MKVMQTFNKEPRDDDRIIAETKIVLQLYRPVKWRIQKNKMILETDFRMEYGTDIDQFLDKIYQAGVDVNTDIKDFKVRVDSLNESNMYIRMIDEAVEALRNYDSDARDVYYEIIKRNYLEPRKVTSNEQLIESMIDEGFPISHATFYRYQRKALLVIGDILWGCRDIRLRLEKVKREVMEDEMAVARNY